MIDQFWYNEYHKDAAIVETLWSCVNQIQDQISNKIRWSFEENVAADDGGWNSDKERELSTLEAQLEAEQFASYSAYDDGYDSNNSQTWDHPDYN